MSILNEVLNKLDIEFKFCKEVMLFLGLWPTPTLAGENSKFVVKV